MENGGYSMTKYLEFEEKNDEEIAIEAKAGNVIAQEYLINKYESFVKTKAKSYFLIGADREDIYQEGMIGLIRLLETLTQRSFQHLKLLQNFVLQGK